MAAVLGLFKAAIAKVATLLRSRPDVTAITVPGCIGGAVVYWLGGEQFQDTFPSSPGLLLSVVLGLFSGIVLIGLITNTDRKDVLRLVALAFLGGLAWPLVISQGLDLLFGQNRGPGGPYIAAGEVVGAASQVRKDDPESDTEQLRRVASEFAENLPEEGPLRDDVLDSILRRLAVLEEYQRRAAIDALEAQLQLDTGETERLEDLRDVATPTEGLRVFADPIEAVVPNHLMQPPSTFAEIGETAALTTDEQGGIGFRPTEVSRYEIQTALSSNEGDLMAALYSVAGGPPIVVDDDSGADLNPRIETTLETGENYVLKLFHYGSGQAAAEVSVSFRRLSG